MGPLVGILLLLQLLLLLLDPLSSASSPDKQTHKYAVATAIRTITKEICNKHAHGE